MTGWIGPKTPNVFWGNQQGLVNPCLSQFQIFWKLEKANPRKLQRPDVAEKS